MKQPTDLFDLIRTLTPAEKGYFKKYIGLHGTGQKRYVQLFDAINAQKQYDEAALKKKLGSAISNLSMAKQHLYDSLLDALVQFNTQSAPIESYRLLARAQVLSDKNLPDQTIEAARQAYEHAEKNELHSSAYESIVHLFAQTIPRNNPEELEHFRTVLQPQLVFHARQSVLLAEHHRHTVIFQQNFATRIGPLTLQEAEELKQLSKDYFEQFDPANESLEVQLNFYNGAAGYFRSQKRYPEVLYHEDHMYQTKKAMFGKSGQGIYDMIIVLNHLCITSTDFHLRSRLRFAIDEQIQLLQGHQNKMTRREYVTLQGSIIHHQLEYLIVFSGIKEAQLYYTEQQHWIAEHQKELPAQITVGLEMCLLQLYFLNNDYNNCLKVIREIVYDTPLRVRVRNKVSALLYQLAIYYDTEDYYTLQQQLPYIYKTILRLNYKARAMEVLLQFLRNHARAGSLKVAVEHWQELKEQLVQAKGETNLSPFGYFHATAWINSRLNHSTFQDEYRQYVISQHRGYCKALGLQPEL